MTTTRKRTPASRQVVLVLVVMAATLGYMVPVSASHPEVSLEGSEFEMDVDANLKVDDPPSIDWASVTESRQVDLLSGSGDNSFGGGTKEDTAVPKIEMGSIPPNKSDLKTFGVYVEETGSDKFIHLFWTRVQDPTGSTNMDFEFNQKHCGGTGGNGCSSNGVTPIRTAGDLLVIYDLTNGGTTPVLSLREWSGSAWGPTMDLTSAGAATGSINSSPIPSADADELGDLSARTFGEASIDLDFIFDENACESFGSAYLKSRSSFSFTSALKDFIAPQPVNLTNCGRVVVEKVDEAGSPLEGAEFTVDPPNVDGVENLEEVEDTTGVFCIDSLIFGDTYTIHESVVPSSYEGAADQTYVPSVAGNCSDVTGSADLTFVNTQILGAIKVVKVAKHAASSTGSIPHEGVTFTISRNGTDVGMVTTDANGEGCLGGLALGQYTVTETVPAGYEGEAAKTVTVTEGTCTAGPVEVNFTNTPLSNITVSFDSQIQGGTKSKIACTGLTATPADSSPGDFDDSSETFEDLAPGTYACTVEIDP